MKRLDALVSALLLLIVAAVFAAPLPEVAIPGVVNSNIPESAIALYDAAAEGGYDWLQPYSARADDGAVHVYALTGLDYGTNAYTVTDNVYNWAVDDRPNWHICPSVVGPDGKTYISVQGLYSYIHQYVYDPAQPGQLPYAPALTDALAGSDGRGLAVGCDGAIWHAARDASLSYSASKVAIVRYDPAAGTVTTWHGLGPTQNPAICNSVACDGTWAYYSSGRNPYTIGAVELATGQDVCPIPIVSGGTVPASTTQGAVYQLRWGVFGSTNRVNYWLYHGVAYPQSAYPTAPWPGGSTAPATAWVNAPPVPTVDASAASPRSGGAVTWRYTWAGKTLTASFNVATQTPVTSRVAALPDGRILCTAGAYYGNWFVDTATHAATWTAPDSIMSPYASTICGSYVYQCGYGSGRVSRFDWTEPWTTGTLRADGSVIAEADPDANPSYVFTCKDTLKPTTYPIDALECVATAQTRFGPRVYCTGQARRAGTNGGILTVLNPATGATNSLYGPFRNEQTDYVRSSPDGRYLAISCHRVADGSGVLPKPDSGCIFVYDTSVADDTIPGNERLCLTRRIVPAYGSKGAGNIVWVSSSQVVGLQGAPVAQVSGGWADSTTQSILYRVNALTGAIEQSVTLPWCSPWNLAAQGEQNDLSLGPDGMLYTFGGSTLYRIDPANLTIQTAVGTVNAPGQMAWSGKDLYLSGAADGSLRHIPDATALP